MMDNSKDQTFWKTAKKYIMHAMAEYFKEEPDQGAMTVSVMALIGYCKVKEMEIKRRSKK
jgi:hypothetical protein